MLIFGEKMSMSAEFKDGVTQFIYNFDFPYRRFDCAKFHRFRKCEKFF